MVDLHEGLHTNEMLSAYNHRGNRKPSSSQMVDLHEGFDANEMLSTYNRVNRELAYNLGTGKILAAVTKGGMTTSANRLNLSDNHHALSIDLKYTQVFFYKGKNISARKHQGLSK